MNFFRSIAMVLIVALATSPAIAAICTTSCASQTMVAYVHADDMAGMKNCHEGSMSKDKSKSSTGHKSCAMGAGCNFTQVIPQIDASSNSLFADKTSISFPRFVPSQKSIDLSPPLKPPA